jgi:DNA mismatch repair ATPase MutS
VIDLPGRVAKRRVGRYSCSPSLGKGAIAIPAVPTIPAGRADGRLAQPKFLGVLHARPEADTKTGSAIARAAFADLQIDKIIGAITAGRDQYDLETVFRSPLADVDAIQFRHEIFRDLEDGDLFSAIKSFSTAMDAVHASLAHAEQFHNRHQKQGWFLDAVHIYGDALCRLADQFRNADPQSRGLRAFAKYLSDHVGSAEFDRLLDETKGLQSELSAVTYCIEIKGDRVTVRKYESEEEYGSTLLATFGKFKQETVRDYTVKGPSSTHMNQIEAAVLGFVTRLYPEEFAALDSYCEEHADFLDEAVAAFVREIQFYIAYREHMARFGPSLRFCYPEISATDKAISAVQCFDLALAENLRSENAAVICNDFSLGAEERVFVVSGPNQGGKTTFARTFGQLHFLASIGCPVPGETARLFLFDRLFTHFDKEEDTTNARGRLEDDLLRIQEILAEATPSSIVIMNEIFSSTSLSDALLLGKKILARIAELDLLCVFVTFLDELAGSSNKIVSLVSTVDDDNPAVRTYKIRRQPADGLAYAMSIAEKYGLTYRRLKQRIAP